MPNTPNSIRIGDTSSGFAEITECNFSIQKSFVGYRFSFNFKINPFKSEDSNPVVLQKLDIELSYRNSGAVYLLGRMIDDLHDGSRKLAGYDFSARKYFDIRTDDFLRLVDISHRGDMIFEFEVLPVFRDFARQAKSETGTLKISHSDWLRIIGSAELDRFELITIRIPVSSSHLHPPFSEALKKIREAEQQYIRGDWNGAGASCRAAWKTVLSSAPPGAKALEHLLTPLIGDPRRKEFGLALIKGLHEIQNKAVHLEGDVKNGTPPADLSAEDALLCIHWYSAIIGYVSVL